MERVPGKPFAVRAHGALGCAGCECEQDCQDRCAGTMCQASEEVLAIWKAAQVWVELCITSLQRDSEHSLITCAHAGSLL